MKNQVYYINFYKTDTYFFSILHTGKMFKDTVKNIKVPQGYITDGASIPRLFWFLYPPNQPEHLAPAVVHDYLTDIALEKKDYNLFVESDKVFKEMLKAYGCSFFKTTLFYLSCRLYHFLRYK